MLFPNADPGAVPELSEHYESNVPGIYIVGALGGYSAIWLARAVGPGGKVVTLEIDPKHAEVARGSIAKAGLADRVDIRIGPAIGTLPKLAGDAPFDFSFIDADKESNADYFAWALKLSRPGALIVVDNVVRDGKVIEPGFSSQVDGVRRLVDALPERTPADGNPRALGRLWADFLAAHPVDLVLLDVHMPGLDGMAVGRALRQNPRTARAKIAMHTGLDEAQVRAGFSGYDAFVPKASHPRLLGERVDSLLRGHAA